MYIHYIYAFYAFYSLIDRSSDKITFKNRCSSNKGIFTQNNRPLSLKVDEEITSPPNDRTDWHFELYSWLAT